MKSLIKIALVLGITLFVLSTAGSCKKKNSETGNLTRVKIDVIEFAIDAYQHDTGQPPKKLTDLISVPVGLENVWKGHYLKESQICDPWGNMYIYEPNSLNPANYKLMSYGADGKPGGKGYNTDIYND